MVTILNDKEIPSIIEKLSDSNNEQCNDLLQKLILYIQKEGIKAFLQYIRTLFNKLEILLKDQNLSVVIQSLQLLLEIINASPKEIEPHFNLVIGQVVINLGDNKV